MNTYRTFNDLVHGLRLSEAYPSIIVSPNGDSGYWSDWYNAGALGPPMYETYVIRQLIPLIDARYRTIADRSERAVFGISMGGYGAMMVAARHPDLFAAAATLSGAVDSNLPTLGAALSASPTFQGGQADAIYGPRSADEIRWHGHNPADLADNLRDVDLQVRTAEGLTPDLSIESPGEGTATDCTLERGVFDMTTAFHKSLVAYGIPHVWKDYGAGCHTIPNFRREFTDSLPGLEDVFANPQPRPRSFNYRSIEPHFEIWGWRIDADPSRALEFLRLQDAGRGGVTLVGSGQTEVTTPPLFRRAHAVAVRTPSGRQVVRPGRHGRLHLTVDLGPAHPDQEDTDSARAAGQGMPDYFTRVRVTFTRAVK
jgi:S-formylglutathione hydrolase FrmB